MQWRDADEESGEGKAMVYKMSKNSLTASKTIGPLVPGHTYILAACDVESDGSLSDVKLEQLFETKCKCTSSRRLQYPSREAVHINVFMWSSKLLNSLFCTQVTFTQIYSESICKGDIHSLMGVFCRKPQN